MTRDSRPLSRTFVAFFDSERAAAVILIGCTIVSLVLANSAAAPAWTAFWQRDLGGHSIVHWVNDGLMAVFFLLVGLELERELYVGELSNFRAALLPIAAAVGGMLAPAGIHLALNAGTPMQAGAGIPMATDIAFALGVMALLGDRVPASLKVFLVALAVMDDLGAIAIIAAFYSTSISVPHLMAALGVFAILVALNRVRVTLLQPYLAGGAFMWWFMVQSGVHATIAGVMLAFAIPFSARAEDDESPSHRLENLLHKPVAFVVLPLFALANTGVAIGGEWREALFNANVAGIAAGLVLGKPIGIALACWLAVRSGLCRLPGDIGWPHVIGAGMLGGIGFTMSIFIANLAFAATPGAIDASKLAILAASLAAGIGGFAWLAAAARTPATRTPAAD